MSYVVNNHLNDLYVLSNKAVGPGKNPKSINIGPTFIPESWVRIKRYFDSIGCMYYSETSKYIALLSLAI